MPISLSTTASRDKQPPSRLEKIPDEWTIPHEATCGEFLKVDKDGSFRFPGANHRDPKLNHERYTNCTYVLEAPKGYGFEITLPDLPRLGSNLR